MYAPERQQKILDTAHAAGRVEVVSLAEVLSVTPETVRRDLTALERRGFVRRVHGGALPVGLTEVEPSVGARLGHSSAQKRRIAARALAELPAEGTVLLDSGTTTQAIAEELPAGTGLTIVTNSVVIAGILNPRDDIDLYVLGGRIRKRTSAAVGTWVTNALADVCVDVAFLGTNGFSLARGLTTPDQAEAVAKAAMASAARRVVVVSDSAKAGRDHFHRFCSLQEADMLITDTGLDDETADAIDATGTDVVRA